MKIVFILHFFLVLIPSFGQNDSIENEIEELISILENMPEYPGGWEALNQYFITNPLYTEAARKAQIKGFVYVQFWVEKDGSVSNPRILRGLHPDLDSISIALISQMPKWIPGFHRGQAVAVQYQLPIAFQEGPTSCFARPEPSDYWKTKGKQKFYKRCLKREGKSQKECDCWYNFILWNYNHYSMRLLDCELLFTKQVCD